MTRFQQPDLKDLAVQVERITFHGEPSAIEKFLGSGLFKDIGPETANAILKSSAAAPWKSSSSNPNDWPLYRTSAPKKPPPSPAWPTA